MYVGNVCAWKDWGREIIHCTDNQALLASFWGQGMGWEGGKPWQPVAIPWVKHCVALHLSGGTHVPETMNIPCSCEVQGNLYMLVISVREVLVVSGKILFFHISERHWAMLKTTGGGYQRATFSPSHLLLQWEMAGRSYKSDGANKVTFLDTLIQTTKALKGWDFELDYALSSNMRGRDGRTSLSYWSVLGCSNVSHTPMTLCSIGSAKRGKA